MKHLTFYSDYVKVTFDDFETWININHITMIVANGAYGARVYTTNSAEPTMISEKPDQVLSCILAIRES